MKLTIEFNRCNQKSVLIYIDIKLTFMFRHFIHCMVFVAVIGISLTMVTNLFKSKFDKELFITGNAISPEKNGYDSTAVDYTGTPCDDYLRHK